MSLYIQPDCILLKMFTSLIVILLMASLSIQVF